MSHSRVYPIAVDITNGIPFRIKMKKADDKTRNKRFEKVFHKAFTSQVLFIICRAVMMTATIAVMSHDRAKNPRDC